MKLWSGRFTANTHESVDDYNASIEFDHQLAEYDIQGSLAHVKMLEKCQILDQKSADAIVIGLKEIQLNALAINLSDEDIHTTIERMLYDMIGEDAKKLHTGRSRNDQVALDMHLYLRHQILALIHQLVEINQVFIKISEENIDVFIPGYTHLQRAEPIRFSQHMLAYFNMFFRDIHRLIDCFARVNVCPLGAGALAGSGFPIDREYVKEMLGFDSVYENSLDAVSDRDFVAEFLFSASMIMMHFSKLSEEIILWSSQEFSFIELDDQFCTGSSMMPQKKNPDVAELARAKVGRVYGSLMGLFTVLKGLPLAYNKDLQEDKEGVFDAVKTLKKTLAAYSPMLASMKLNKKKLHNEVNNDYSNATQLANYLVIKGLSFRDAHSITGQIVLYCINNNIYLRNLSFELYQQFSPLIERDIFGFISIESVIEKKCSVGGTAKKAVLDQLENAKKKLHSTKNWLTLKQSILENML